MVSIANSIPLHFDGDLVDLPEDGWDWVLTKGLDDLAQGRRCNLQSAIQVVVFGDRRGQGVSSQNVSAMKEIGVQQGLSGMIAPVRPSQKCDYPLTSIDTISNGYVPMANCLSMPGSGYMLVPAPKLLSLVIALCELKARWQSGKDGPGCDSLIASLRL